MPKIAILQAVEQHGKPHLKVLFNQRMHRSAFAHIEDAQWQPRESHWLFPMSNTIVYYLQQVMDELIWVQHIQRAQ